MTKLGTAVAVAVFVVGASLVVSLPAGAADAAASSAPNIVSRCAEDSAGDGDAPTISSRFDLKEAGNPGVAFVDARERALRYCGQHACTIEGIQVPRTAKVYAIGLLHRRPVAGFRCMPVPATKAASSPVPEIVVTIGDLSEIDAAVAKAAEQCAAPARPELSDLRKRDGAVVAVFACS